MSYRGRGMTAHRAHVHITGIWRIGVSYTSTFHAKEGLAFTSSNDAFSSGMLASYPVTKESRGAPTASPDLWCWSDDHIWVCHMGI